MLQANPGAAAVLLKNHTCLFENCHMTVKDASRLANSRIQLGFSGRCDDKTGDSYRDGGTVASHGVQVH
jgi:hypothetical protein